MAGKSKGTNRIEKFKATYFAECAERIVAIENTLDGLKAGGDDPVELLNEMFRAVHSIKGGASAFGFENIVSLSHIFEAVLDALRNQNFDLNDDILDTLYFAEDALNNVVEATESGAGPNREELKTITGKLDELLSTGGAGTKPATSQTVQPETTDRDKSDIKEERSKPESAGERTVLIRFIPNDDFFRTANDPILIFRELRELGPLVVEPDVNNLPALSNLNPDLSYLGWTLKLTTAEPLDLVREAFEFVEDDCLLDITEPAEEQDIASEQPTKEGAPDAISTSMADQKSQEPVKADKVDGARSKGAGKANLPMPQASIRVELDRVDKLVNMVGELVITQSVVEQQMLEAELDNDATAHGIETLSVHMRELQEDIMAIRMQPVKSIFARVPRLIREISRSLGKNVRLTTVGETTEVDKSIIESLNDPITHLIRNAIDHGIEPPEDRKRLGKPEEATITISAGHRNGRIAIQVSDDGRGIDCDKVLAKAIEKGIVDRRANLTREEIYDLIFAPGFSTVEQVSDVSGRGVGMDVVRRGIQDIGGRIVVQSEPGKGTSFLMSLPLTLAVMDGLIVTVAGEKFVLPMTCTIESARPTKSDLSAIADSQLLVKFRGQFVPLLFLHQLFNIPGAIKDPDKALVVFCETDIGAVIGIVVDQLIEQRQVVIKSLEENYHAVDGVSAATILGDGRVALILEVNGLHEMYKKSDVRRYRHRPRDGAHLTQAQPGGEELQP